MMLILFQHQIETICRYMVNANGAKFVMSTTKVFLSLDVNSFQEDQREWVKGKTVIQ